MDRNDVDLESKEVHNSAMSRSSVSGSQTSSEHHSSSNILYESFRVPIQKLEEFLGTSELDGLTEARASDLHSQYGPNKLDDEGGISITSILIRQICNAMVLVLVISMAISFGIRDWIAGGVIAAVIGLNVGIGFVQEYSAEKTMNSLRDLSSPTADVIREGKEHQIASMNVVPGDVVVIKVGDTVPADIRLFETMNLEADEALLTGESLPVAKTSDMTYGKNDTVPVGDRLNMAYSSSLITKGRAKGIVTGIGMETEIGKIAQSLQGSNKKFRPVKRDEHGNSDIGDFTKAFFLTVNDIIGNFLGTNIGTPLQRKLSKLAILLFWVAVVFAIVVMAANKFKVSREVAIYAIATALSMIPASLVVVLTITMSVGAKVMIKRHVIVRKLDSLEALGSVSAICSDKTGTLTQGKMIVRKVWVPSVGTYEVRDSQHPFNPEDGQVLLSSRSPLETAPPEAKILSPEARAQLQSQEHETSDEKTLSEEEPQPLNNITKDDLPSISTLMLRSATLANIATVRYDDAKDEWKTTGDATEVAIQVFCHRMSWARSSVTSGDHAPYKWLAEYPFDSAIKRMTAIYADREADKTLVLTKGAVERVLPLCNKWYGTSDGESSTREAQSLDDGTKASIFSQVDALANQGLRVLAVAYREWNDDAYTSEQRANKTSWDEIPREQVEENLIFLGLFGIYDPPRTESLQAVRQCHLAGINVHMLTGDHISTAKAIAKEVGIIPRNMYHYGKEVAQSMVMSAQDFDNFNDEEIDKLPVLPLVIARCAPQTKVRMIEALHRRNAFCAMTGDGVNDSPSLKKADVGIAMGMSGSDVAKGASDIILTDDNFASILNAVEEGRRMADNIQKFVLHLLAGNIAQAIYLLLGLVFQDENKVSVFPLSPVEVLWIIMITSSLPAMGLGMEKALPGSMERPPRDQKSGVFTWEVIIDMLMYGTWMAAICIVSFVIVIYPYGGGELGRDCNKDYSEVCRYVFRARSTTFAELTWLMLFLAWEVIDTKRSVFRMHPDTDTPYTQVFKDLWGNQFLFWSVIAGFVTVFPTIYIPVINKIVFLHSPIGWEWGIVVASVFVFMAGCEVIKYCKRVYLRRRERKLGVSKATDIEDGSQRMFDRFASYSVSMDNGQLTAQKQLTN